MFWRGKKTSVESALKPSEDRALPLHLIMEGETQTHPQMLWIQGERPLCHLIKTPFSLLLVLHLNTEVASVTSPRQRAEGERGREEGGKGGGRAGGGGGVTDDG